MADVWGGSWGSSWTGWKQAEEAAVGGGGSISGVGTLVGAGYHSPAGGGAISSVGLLAGAGYTETSGGGPIVGVGVLVGGGLSSQQPQQQNTGGWITLDEYRKGREEYVRQRRIALGILPADEESASAPAPIPEAAEAVATAAKRQTGLRMSQAQREADLAREMQQRNVEWRQEYVQALYAQLYRHEQQRREDDLIVALLAA